MKYYCNPMNLEYRYQFFETPEENGKLCKVSREAADPSLILFKGKSVSVYDGRILYQ